MTSTDPFSAPPPAPRRRRAVLALLLAGLFLAVSVATSVVTLGALCTTDGSDRLLGVARAHVSENAHPALPDHAVGCALPQRSRDTATRQVDWTAPVTAPAASGPHATATFALG